MLQKINEIFIEVFDEEDLVITEETSAKDIEDWDSLNHITLVSQIEKSFNVKFTMQNIIEMKNVGEMMTIMERMLGGDEKSILDGVRNSEHQNEVMCKLFEEAAAKYGMKTAVVTQAGKVTYEELLNHVNVLAIQLLEEGIGREDRVAVMTSRNIETIVAIYAILRVGAVYVPLDESMPVERVKYILKDSNAKLLFTTGQSVDMSIKTMAVDLNTVCKKALELDYPVAQTPAYMIYTSGTTGYPKGVLIQNDWLVNLVRWNIKAVSMTEESIVMMLFSFAFDASIKNIFSPLIMGAELVLGPNLLFDVENVKHILEDNKVSHCNTSPGLFYMLLEESKEDQFKAMRFLEYVMLGGEALEPEMLRLWAESDLSFQLINAYGPTEGTSISTCYNVKKEDVLQMKNIPIGKPIQNRKICIVNEQGALCKSGETGELWIAGLGVIEQYAGAYAANRENFFENEYKWYKTGDIVRINENGNLEFHGRQDSQVKISGHRVELQEIEAVLNESDFVHRSVCQFITYNQKKILVAFLIPENAFLWDVNMFKKELVEKLSSYMIPSEFILVDEFTLNQNGKIDQKKLTSLFYEKMEIKKQNAAIVQEDDKENSVQEKLTEIWKDLLHLEKVGLDDNFFDVGGYSLLLNKLLRKIANETGYSVTILDLMSYPTIRTCADFMLKSENDVSKKEDDAVKDEVALKLRKRMEKIQQIRNRRINK